MRSPIVALIGIAISVLSTSGARLEVAGRVAVPATAHAQALTASPIPAPAVHLPKAHGPRVVALAVEHGIPLAMLARMITYESGWVQSLVVQNPNGTRDYGLMQLNGAYIADFAWRYNTGKAFDPLDPEDNLRIGTRHLATLYRVAGTWRDAAAAYNCGLTRSRRLPLPATTERYLAAIFPEEATR